MSSNRPRICIPESCSSLSHGVRAGFIGPCADHALPPAHLHARSILQCARHSHCHPFASSYCHSTDTVLQQPTRLSLLSLKPRSSAYCRTGCQEPALAGCVIPNRYRWFLWARLWLCSYYHCVWGTGSSSRFRTPSAGFLITNRLSGSGATLEKSQAKDRSQRKTSGDPCLLHSRREAKVPTTRWICQIHTI